MLLLCVVIYKELFAHEVERMGFEEGEAPTLF